MTPNSRSKVLANLRLHEIRRVQRPDPMMFLGYQNNPQATQEKFAGEYLLTGDTGRRELRSLKD
jgi:acyl-coenzyme A synthetase/AMP-(fatty) acid ligase